MIGVKIINWRYKEKADKMEEEIEEMKEEQIERVQLYFSFLLLFLMIETFIHEKIKRIANHPIYTLIKKTLEKLESRKSPPTPAKPTNNPSVKPVAQPSPVPQVSNETPSKENETIVEKPIEPKTPVIKPVNVPKIDITAPVPTKRVNVDPKVPILTKTSVRSPNETPPTNKQDSNKGMFAKFIDALVPESPKKDYSAPEISFIKEMRNESRGEGELNETEKVENEKEEEIEDHKGE